MFGTPDFGHSDIWHFNFPLKFFLSQTLKDGHFPFWSKDIGMGFPLLGEGQVGAFNLVNIIIFRFLDPVSAFNVGFITIFLTAAAGCYLYARAIGLKRLTSLFLALIFPFSGVFVTQVTHFNLLQAASFLPLEFFLTEKLIQTGKIRWGFLFSIVLAQQIFAGFQQATMISLTGAGLYFILRQKITLRKSLVFVLSSVLGFLIALPQLLPTLELSRLAGRGGGLTVAQLAQFPFTPQHLLTFFKPYFFGDPRIGTYQTFNNNWGIFWESTGYLGIIPLILVLILIIKRKIRGIPGTYFIIAAVSLVLLLGKFTPFFVLFQFPPLSLFRVPARFLLLFVWCLSVLSAISLNSIKKRAAVFLIIFISVIDLAGFSLNYNAVIDAEKWLGQPESVSFLKTDASWFRIYSLWPAENWNKIFLTRGWKNTDDYLALRNALDPNQNLYWGIASIDSYAGMTPRRSILYRNLVNEGLGNSVSTGSARLLSLAGVKYLLAQDSLQTDWVQVSSTSAKPQTFIYLNPHPLPHAYTVTDFKIVSGVTDLLDSLRNYSDRAILESAIPLMAKPGPIKEARVVKNSDLEVVVIAQNDQESLLILSDSYYPGWEARVDGQKTEIYPVNLNQRAVIVPAGKHQIDFSYKPLRVSF